MNNSPAASFNQRPQPSTAASNKANGQRVPKLVLFVSLVLFLSGIGQLISVVGAIVLSFLAAPALFIVFAMFQIIAGIVSIALSIAIIKLRRWALYTLSGLVVLEALVFLLDENSDPLFFFLHLAVVIYLWIIRRRFQTQAATATTT